MCCRWEVSLLKVFAPMGSKMAGKIYKDKGILQICLIPVLQTLMCRQCLGGIPPVGMLPTQQVLMQPEPISKRRSEKPAGPWGQYASTNSPVWWDQENKGLEMKWLKTFAALPKDLSQDLNTHFGQLTTTSSQFPDFQHTLVAPLSTYIHVAGIWTHI